MNGKAVMRHNAESNKRPRLYMSAAARREVLLVAQGIEAAMGEDLTAMKWVRKLRRAAAEPKA